MISSRGAKVTNMQLLLMTMIIKEASKNSKMTLSMITMIEIHEEHKRILLTEPTGTIARVADTIRKRACLTSRREVVWEAIVRVGARLEYALVRLWPCFENAHRSARHQACSEQQ